MKTFERLDEAATPDGTVLTLYRHDYECTIRIDGVESMLMRRHRSERQLAEGVSAPLLHRRNVRVLIRAFDDVMLDVDNGADPLTTAGNARLYHAVGIHRVRARVTSGDRHTPYVARRTD